MKRRAFDFGFQFVVESIERIAPDVVAVTGTIKGVKYEFVVSTRYKVGDKMYVLGYMTMGDYNVVREGLVIRD